VQAHRTVSGKKGGTVALLALTVLGPSGCGNDPGVAKAAPPATVTLGVKESELSTITLSPEAETRLGIVVHPVAEEPMRETKLLGGDVVVPPGDAVDITAPVAGTLAAPEGPPPRPGLPVRRGQPLLRLVPLLPADGEISISAERDVATTLAALRASEKKLARVERLLQDGSASQRSVEETELELETARAAHGAALERLALVRRNPVTEAGELLIVAPLDGLIQAVQVAPGQTVAANARLLQVVRVARLWVRVPVYAGEVRTLDPGAGADVLRLDEDPAASGAQARNVAAPPAADPSTATVDLVFELTGAPAQFQPGERVLVRLAGRANEIALVVPDSALLHDIHGGSWVYERVAPRVYARRRVDVRTTVDGAAVLARGPAPGAMVVTTGAAELYGVEFGSGK
jgi:RND family efflux transporter MFP subunit